MTSRLVGPCLIVTDLQGNGTCDYYDEEWHYLTPLDAFKSAWQATADAYEDACVDEEPRRFRSERLADRCVLVECSACEQSWEGENGGSVHFRNETEARECITSCDWTWINAGQIRCDSCPPTYEEITAARELDRTPISGQLGIDGSVVP